MSTQQITQSARESLIANYAEKCRRELAYGSTDFAALYARSAAHYALEQPTAKQLCDKLVVLLSDLDWKERKQEEKRGLRVNIYRIGHYLGAVNSIREDVLVAVPAHRFIDAFKDSFNPTRGLHGVAKKLGLPLDVENGRWVEIKDSHQNLLEAAQAAGILIVARVQ